MFPAFLLSLREGLEAALIVGIVLGILKKLNRDDLKSSIWLGVFSAVVVSLVVGGLLTALGSSFEGKVEQVFEGVTMLLAAGILTWMIFWMNRQRKQFQNRVESEIRKAIVIKSSRRAIFGLALFAVVREGIELALFLTATTFAVQGGSVVVGALVGLGAAVLLGWLLFSTSIRLDVKQFFQVTGVLLILFAAGLVAHGVHEFNEAAWIPSIVENVYNINPVLDENSVAGVILKTVFGYNGNPSLTEVIAYLGYFALVLLGLRRQNGSMRHTLPQTVQSL